MTLSARAGGGSCPGPAARGLALLFSRRTGLALPQAGLLALAGAAPRGDQRLVSAPELDWGENLSCGGVCRDTLIPKSPGAGRTLRCAAKAASPLPEPAGPSVRQHPESRGL